ncbi:hypothetical protein LJC01_01535 [Clostridiaceae bacterium OttesenSCG-928-D20]|nr:hypothetical protein [Clostridiaceae bacterium OttesenSCG-928-D20]
MRKIHLLEASPEKKPKTALIAILLLLAVIFIAAGILIYRESKIIIDVYPIDQISKLWWGGETITEGKVTTDVTQRVYLSVADDIAEILVSPGESVSVGDPLIRYDDSLIEIQEEIAKLNISILKTRLKNLETEIENLKIRYPAYLQNISYIPEASSEARIVLLGHEEKSPNNAQSYSGLTIENMTHTAIREEEIQIDLLFSPSPTDGDIAQPQNPQAPDTEAPPSPTVSIETPPPSPEIPSDTPPPSPVIPATQSPGGTPNTSIPATGTQTGPTPIKNFNSSAVPYAGMGTIADPFRYFISSGAKIDSRYIVELALADRISNLVMVLETRVGNGFTGEILSSLIITIGVDGSFNMELIHNDSLAPYDPGSVLPSPSPSPDGQSPPPSSYLPEETPPAWLAREEVRLMYRTFLSEQTQINLDLRQMEIDHKASLQKLNAKTINSTISGVVVEIISPETAIASGRPLITVAGGKGYFIKGVSTELSLESISVGQKVSVMSWYSGTQCEGEIVDIGIYPEQTDSTDDITAVQSSYPFTVFVPSEYNLKEGEVVEMTLSRSSNSEGSLYLDRAFVQKDGSSSYVYIADSENNGRLIRREVKTGKLLWGSYVEIREGLSGDENVAFPYGVDTRPGRKTALKDLPENYKGS